MVMDDKILEKYLLDHAIDVADDGFTERVMAALPEAEWQKSRAKAKGLFLTWVWRIVCLVALVGFCVHTHAITNFAIDAMMFIRTFTFDASCLRLLILIALIPTFILMFGIKSLYNKYAF